MRYDLESMLPERAFSPRGGRGPFSRGMTLEGGGKGGGGSAPSADPNIGIAQNKLADISDEYLQNWKNEVWPTMKAQAEKQDARADEQFALDKETQRFQTQIAQEQYQRYQEKFRPLQDKMIAEADQYNTEGNFQRQAALAMGDVNEQFKIEKEAQRMQQRSYGIDPTSGRYQGQENAVGAMQAATKASAATKARTAAEQLGWAKRMDAIGLGQGVFGNQATSTGLALAAGGQALNAGQVTMGNYGQMGQSMGSAYGGAMQGWGQVGSLGVQKYNADVNSYEATQRSNATSSAGFGSMVGSLAATGAKLYMGSDIRTKENIELVGWLPNGLPVYEFEYKPEFKDREYFGHGRKQGVMAHDVEKVIPDAVTTLNDGYKVVDYSKVK